MKSLLILVALTMAGCTAIHRDLDCVFVGKRCYYAETKPKDCTVSSDVNGTLITCEDGTSSFINNGTNGLDGDDCSVMPASNGAVVTCGTDSVVILNGADGKDAELPDKSISDLIDPCGDNPGEFDEVILKMADGTHVVYFQDGNKRFLTVLGPGNYQTTDKQKCNFSIDTNGDYYE